MPKLNQRGVIHLLIPIILLVGIIGGVYLITAGPLKIFPKASELTGRISKNVRHQGYIVEFNTPPKASKNLSKRTALSVEEDSSVEYKKAKEDIVTKILSSRGQRSALSTEEGPNSIVTNEYTAAFSGVAMNITDSEAEVVKSSVYVKRVYPNYEVKADLQESVPLIKADQVWALKDNNQQPINGTGVRVGVIDTGVDWTMSDLGGSSFNTRDFKIIPSPISGKYFYSMSLDGDKIAYTVDGKLYFDSVTNHAPQQITPSDPNFYIQTVKLKGNILVYYGYDGNRVGKLAYYDLNTQENYTVKENAYAIGSLFIENNKIYFGLLYQKSWYSPGPYFYEFDLSSHTYHRALNPIFTSSVDSIVSRVSGNKIIAVDNDGGDTCPKKAVLVNADNYEGVDLDLPNLGPVLDFQGAKILYKECINQQPGSTISFDYDYKPYTFYLYDLETKTYESITYGQSSLVPSSSSQRGLKTTANDLFPQQLDYPFFANIGDGIVYFSPNDGGEKIVGYDISKKAYFEVNFNQFVTGEMSVNAKQVCFKGLDFKIYCFDYDSNKNYSLPSNPFNSKVVDGYDFIDKDPYPWDYNGHGTHVAATIAGDGVLKGVAPGAKIVALRALDKKGSGSTATIVAAIDRAVQLKLDSDKSNDIDILSMSLGANCEGHYNIYCGPDDPLSQSVDRAIDSGITVVVAAGNNGAPRTIGSPGTSRKAITVGAVDKQLKLANFSSQGPVEISGETIIKPDIVAPGVDICAAKWVGAWRYTHGCLDQFHAAISGTSMATPHVAGVAALIKQAHSSWIPNKIKEVIKSTAASLNLDPNQQGAGFIDALKAVQFIDTEPTPTITPSILPTPTPSVCIPCSADIDKDGKVNLLDFSLLSGCSGKKASEKDKNGKSCKKSDINQDQKVDDKDLQCLKSQFGKQCNILPTPTPTPPLIPKPSPKAYTGKCIQVTTRACAIADPRSCYDFPTPCSIPDGWVKK